MGVRVRVIAGLAVLIAAALWMSGCGHYTCKATFGASTCAPTGSGVSGGGGSGNSGTPILFAYFADDNNGNIGAAMLDSAGNFNQLAGFTKPTIPVAIDGGMVVVQGKWLYMPLTTLQIVGFSISSSGALTALPGSPYNTNDTFSITSDPAGKYLFVGGATQDEVSVFQINQGDGSLTEAAGSPFATPIPAWQETTDGLGKFLYVSAGFAGAQVAAYSIDGATGALTAVAGSPFAFNMTQVKGEATGKFLFGVTGQSGVNGTPIDDHIYVFNINQTTGAITPASGSPFVTLYSPINIAVNPKGTLLYSFNEAANGNNSPTEGFQINASTGALTEISGLNTLSLPIGMFDQSGALLVGHGVGSLTALNVNSSTGALTSVANVGIGSNFGWAVVDVP